MIVLSEKLPFDIKLSWKQEENIESENIVEDMSIKITGNLRKNSVVYLQINFNDIENTLKYF